MTNIIPRTFVVLLLLSTICVAGLQLGLGAIEVAAQVPPLGITPNITPGPPPDRVTPSPNHPTTVPITRPPTPTRIPIVTPIPVPAACLNDYGNPVVPRIAQDGVKALTLNFNQSYSPTQTEGCVATRKPTAPDYGGIIVDDIGYEVVLCKMVGANVPPNAISQGAVHFNGDFHIECAMFATKDALSNFYVYAEATFWQTGKAQYQLMEHPDVSVRVKVNPNWAITLASNYNGNIFSNTDSALVRTGQVLPLLSRVENREGKHYISGNTLRPYASQDRFNFVNPAPIIIGETVPGVEWDLHFIAIDPPNSKG